MRRFILFTLTALALTACATAATEAPPLPTVAPTLPPDPNPAQATPAPVDGQQTTSAPADHQQATPPPADGQQPTPSGGLLITPPVQPGDGTVVPTSAIQQVIGMLPPPGTMEVPITEEANPLDAVSPFANILYMESGGPSNASLEIEIFGDGRVRRNGVESSVPPETIAELNQLIRDVKFFSFEGQFTQAGGAPSDSYSYLVRVELESGAARRVDAVDRLTPPELLRMFSKLRTIGA